MKKYDVVIVGGGIAGSVAARYLAKGGINVLFVESGITPRDKPCSAIQFMYFQKLIGKKIPKERLCTNPITRLYLERPNGESMKVPFKMLNFTRDVFDDWLNKIAVEEGAKFRDGVRCDGFKRTEKGYIVSLHPKHQETEKVETRYLIAADGLSSSIKKKIRPQDFQEKKPGITLNYYLKCENDGGLDPNALYQFWNLDFSNLMFAWTYKKNDLWVVGTGHDNDVKGHCDDLLKYVKNKFNFDGEIVKREGYGSKFCLKDPNHTYLGEGNLLFIGDAAGLVEMYRGLGMDAAALSARRVAKAIINAEKSNKTALELYEKSMRKIIKKMNKNAERSLIYIKTNEELLRYLKKNFLKMGMKTFFGNLLNNFRSAEKLKLLPA